jgi:hypothetical protein
MAAGSASGPAIFLRRLMSRRALVTGATGQEREEIEKRFWAKVEKTTDCWTWKGAKKSKGYGELNIRHYPHDAHRISWELANGPIPEKMWVLHRCDNPSCVNPNHLWLGTVLENNRDMFFKKRNKSTGRSTHILPTHCKNGHPFSPDNIRWRLRKREGYKDSFHRVCLTCEYEHNHNRGKK